MNLHLHLHLHPSLPLLSVCFLSLLLLASSASDAEFRSLLEFKKGIRHDPSGKVLLTWNRTGTVATTEKGCPDSWTGIRCNDAGSITAIVLDHLGLQGELKFYTLTGLDMLQNLSLAGNSFTGRLVPSLGLLKSLQYLDLSGNMFYGPIPARINELWGLNYLNLSGNKFTGGFPGGISNLQQLRVLDLHLNELWGDIGHLFSELRNVEFVDLSCNRFSGGLSVGSSNISSLANTVHYVNLSHNELNGGFFSRDSIGLFRNLQILDLGDNQITGELPSFRSLQNLKVLRLANNQLYGLVPAELLEGAISLERLDLSGNGFTGSIRGINSTTLNILNLSFNELSGSLPTSLRSCVILDLSRNMISGDISVMQNWEANLEVVDLSSNRLTGTFPNLSSQFEKLTVLKLGNNMIEGSLPPVVGTYSRLSTVDLGSNGLSGTIPGSFFASVTLVSLNLSGNHFTGPIPFQGSHAGELLSLPSYPQIEVIDLSNNSLSGVLPSDIGSLERLKLLNLSKNGLSGQIPSALAKLSNLDYLDLSGNNFKGRIPNDLPASLNGFNVSYNDLSGNIPEGLRKFPITSFQPGNPSLHIPKNVNGVQSQNPVPDKIYDGKHRSSKHSSRIAIVLASVGAAVMIVFALIAYHRVKLKEFHGRSGFRGEPAERDVKFGRFTRPSFFKFPTPVQAPPSSLSFSNDNLLTSNSRSLSGNTEFVTEIADSCEGGGTASASAKRDVLDIKTATSGRKSSPGSPLSSSPRLIEAPVRLDVYSPDRLAGELFLLDASLAFTAEELSRAPAEVLGRSSHGTLYKATLDGGQMLAVKWLRVGLVKNKKEFAREVKRIGSARHPNIVPLRAYYWGPREQERLLLADFIQGDSLALHLYETTPRRHSLLSFSQRLKVAIEVGRALLYLHDNSLPHGNLKPTNILLAGREHTVCLTDYGLHRLMTPAGIAEQLLNLGALGYCAPELATAAKPLPSLKADVYAFGVILMELLTRRSAGDIISGQSGAVDLTDWVRMLDQEGRRTDCIDRDIAGGEEPSRAMDDLLALSLKCILPVNERPSIRQVLEDLCSVSV